MDTVVEISSTSDSITPIEFVFPGSRKYLDFSRSYFRMELTLTKTDGGNLATASHRWVAPNASHTIIKQPSVYVNGTLITEQTDTYAYKATLKPQGYYSALDYPLATLTANQIDRDTPHNDYKALDPERKKAVNGALDILARITSGKTIQLFGMPHVDLFNTGRILIPGVDFKLRFTLNDPKFFMNGLAGTATNVRLQSGDLIIKFFAYLVKVRSDV